MNEDKAREAQEREEMRAWHETKAACDPSDWSTAESAAYRGFFVHGFRAALQWAASQQADAKAWAVLNEHGDVSMVFLDRAEALTYCGEGEQPVPLVSGGAASQQAAEGWTCPKCGVERYGPLKACMQSGCPASTQGGADESDH